MLDLEQSNNRETARENRAGPRADAEPYQSAKASRSVLISPRFSLVPLLVWSSILLSASAFGQAAPPNPLVWEPGEGYRRAKLNDNLDGVRSCA